LEGFIVKQGDKIIDSKNQLKCIK